MNRPVITNLRLIAGAAVCVYAIVFFVLHFDTNHLLGLAVFVGFGVWLIVGALRGVSERRTWMTQTYRNHRSDDKSAAKADIHARIALAVGWVLLFIGGAWLYIALKYLHWALPAALGVAALAAVPGWVLIAYRSASTGVEQFRAIPKARKKEL
jgi:amino acid transporter